MTKVILFHGTGANPNVCWYPWLKQKLEAKGYSVEVPHYPELNFEPIEQFIPKVLQNHTFDSDTILIGHSGGAALILSVLEHLSVQVKSSILVAGYSSKPNESEEPVLQSKYDWIKIRSNTKDIYFINSVNDPYGCDDQKGREMFEKLGDTLIIKNEGHFGSEFEDLKEFEFLLRLVAL